MTLDEFYRGYCLPLMAEKQSAAEAYKEQYVGVINSVLCEIAPLNRRILAARGREDLPPDGTTEEFSPFSATAELPYDSGLLIDCAAYGVASRLFVDEAGDEANTVGFLESCFETGKKKYSTGRYKPVRKYFAESED